MCAGSKLEGSAGPCGPRAEPGSSGPRPPRSPGPGTLQRPLCCGEAGARPFRRQPGMCVCVVAWGGGRPVPTDSCRPKLAAAWLSIGDCGKCRVSGPHGGTAAPGGCQDQASGEGEPVSGPHSCPGWQRRPCAIPCQPPSLPQSPEPPAGPSIVPKQGLPKHPWPPPSQASARLWCASEVGCRGASAQGLPLTGSVCLPGLIPPGSVGHISAASVASRGGTVAQGRRGGQSQAGDGVSPDRRRPLSGCKYIKSETGIAKIRSQNV